MAAAERHRSAGCPTTDASRSSRSHRKDTARCEIDLARPCQNAHTLGFLPEERAWLDAFHALHPGEPGHCTWWGTVTRARERNVGWRLDYFLVSQGLMSAVRAAGILPQVAGSDHCPRLLETDP